MEAEGLMQKATGHILLLLFVFVASIAFAQTPAPLTNADIEAMVKAGIPENTIIMAIQTAAANGTAQFDTSSAAMVGLKNAGASDRVLTTLLNTPVNPAPGLPTGAGVYFSGASGWQQIPLQELWPPYYSGSLSIRNYETKLPITQPKVQVANGQPCFYVRAYPQPSEWSLAYLGEKDELYAKIDNQMRPQLHVSEVQLRPIKVEQVSTEIQTIKPQVALLPGDYALCKVVPGSGDLLVCYPFRVVQ
jgi:hypothetical protein